MRKPSKMNPFSTIILFLSLTILSLGCFSQEICDNGIDDDFDLLIDGFDTLDCPCGSSPILLPNPSFEDKSCCPNAFSQMRCVDDWRQASNATSDYFNLCGIRTVTFGYPPSPIPNGNGYVGFINGAIQSGVAYPNLKEYIGTCLSDTLKKGVSYELSFWIVNGRGSLSTALALYGSNDCNNQPFGNSSLSFGCPSNDTNWSTLGEINIRTRTDLWTEHVLSFTPSFDAVSIVIGPSCSPASGYNYYYLDYLELNQIDKCNSILTMPTAFTPNKDGINDFFKPVLASNISTSKLTIYNRWGQTMFESSDLTEGWDGSVLGKESSEGTYYWTLSYTNINQDSYIEKGFFNLFR